MQFAWNVKACLMGNLKKKKKKKYFEMSFAEFFPACYALKTMIAICKRHHLKGYYFAAHFIFQEDKKKLQVFIMCSASYTFDL